MADETTRVDVWLQTVLAADATLTGLVGDQVFSELAPQDASFPRVVHQHQGSVDVRTATSSGRIMLSGLWLVRGIAATEDFRSLQAIADRVDVLLERASGSADGGLVFSCTRESPFRLLEPADGGIQYRHLGGLYRIYAQVP